MNLPGLATRHSRAVLLLTAMLGAVGFTRRRKEHAVRPTALLPEMALREKTGSQR